MISREICQKVLHKAVSTGGNCYRNNCINQTFSIGNHMISLLIRLICSRSGKKCHVSTAPI